MSTPNPHLKVISFKLKNNTKSKAIHALTKSKKTLFSSQTHNIKCQKLKSLK